MSLVGRTLGGRYAIVSLLGKGGMGEVYEAEQIDLRRRVAIKVLTAAAGAHELLRFKQEALAVAGLAHPNIVQVIDFVDGDEPFLVMEMLRGRSLTSLVRERGKLAPARAVTIMTQVLSALAAAHEARIVHRDVKPENIFICDSPDPLKAGRRKHHSPLGNDLAKVLDFGLARPLDDEKRLARTRVGMAMGTPAYMAPEQARGKSADIRVDVFAAGATLYFALAGRRPFDGKTASELLHAVKTQPPVPLDAICPELELDLVRVVERSLSKDPDARFASARAFLDALMHGSPKDEAKRAENAEPRVAPTVTTRGAPRKKTPAIAIQTPALLVKPIAAGMASHARFDASGETALAIGPAGLARLRDGAWSARELPPGLTGAVVRGSAFGPAGEVLVFTETAAWMRAAGGYTAIDVPGLAIRGAHVDHASHVTLAGSIGKDGVIVECTPKGPAIHVIGSGIAMNDVARASGALVACGERGTLCVIEGGRVHAHVAGKSSLRAIAPAGGGFVAVGSSGALVFASAPTSEGLAAAREVAFAPCDLFAVRTRAKWVCTLGTAAPDEATTVRVARLDALESVACTSVEGATIRDVWLGNGVLRIVLDTAAVLESELTANGAP